MKLSEMVFYAKFCSSCENFTINCPWRSSITGSKCLGRTAVEERKENGNDDERKETV